MCIAVLVGRYTKSARIAQLVEHTTDTGGVLGSNPSARTMEKENLSIFRINAAKEDYYENILKKSIDDLNSFYGINWVHHLPRVVIVPDRATIDMLKSEKTQSWVVGWSDGRTSYVLDKDNLEKESSHKYKPDTYFALLKHEVSHNFYHIVSGGQYKPMWLCEGVAIYTSGQNKEKKKPNKFSSFLEFTDKGGEGVYTESGFVVQLLVDKFGKPKMLELIKNLKSVGQGKTFDALFNDIYGFALSYEEFNKLYSVGEVL